MSWETSPMQPEEIIMFSLGLIPFGPTDGSDAWGGGPMPWSMLEGSEIQKDIKTAEQAGDTKTATALRMVNDHAMAVEAALRNQQP